MRLPIQGGSQSPVDRFNPSKLVDEEETAKMVEYAIGQGVNYFDTAYVYHGGKSELALGKALKRYRDQVAKGCFAFPRCSGTSSRSYW
jgi:predicted aldo/keto reductase-like oxidoreductase